MARLLARKEVTHSLVRKTSRKPLTRFQENSARIVTLGYFLVQPGTSITPPALRRGQRNSQRLGTLLHRQSGKVPELDQLGLGSILQRELLQGFIEGKDVLGKTG